MHYSEQPAASIVYVQNGVTMETGKILGGVQTVEAHAQMLVDKFYGGGKVTLVKQAI